MKTKSYISRLVFSILRDRPETRDEWMLMIKEIHNRQMSLYAISKEEYYDAFFDGQLANVDTIKRVWALIQEKYPELRGENWVERQIQGGVIASSIVDINNQLDLF